MKMVKIKNKIVNAAKTFIKHAKDSEVRTTFFFTFDATHRASASYVAVVVFISGIFLMSMKAAATALFGVVVFNMTLALIFSTLTTLEFIKYKNEADKKEKPKEKEKKEKPIERTIKTEAPYEYVNNTFLNVELKGGPLDGAIIDVPAPQKEGQYSIRVLSMEKENIKDSYEYKLDVEKKKADFVTKNQLN